MTIIPKQVNVSIGDKIYHDKILCEITTISGEEIVCKGENGLNYIINANSLNGKSFEYIIEFNKQNDLFGKSRTDTLEKAKKEESLLKEYGWETKIYQQEKR
ncbi:MAG: hypothetical protein WC401_06525 [Bacteroidales bacterium]